MLEFQQMPTCQSKEFNQAPPRSTSFLKRVLSLNVKLDALIQNLAGFLKWTAIHAHARTRRQTMVMGLTVALSIAIVLELVRIAITTLGFAMNVKDDRLLPQPCISR
jgi:hypothetical protein